MNHNTLLIAPNKVMLECLIYSNGGNTAPQNSFTEQPQLVNRPIIAIEAFCDVDVSYSPFNPTIPVMPSLLMQFAFLNIMRAGDEVAGSDKAGIWYKNMPLCSLRNVYNARAVNATSCLDKFRCEPMTVQWRDTNISFPVPQNTAGQTYSALFLMTYLLENQDPTPFRRAFKKGILPHSLPMK